MHIIHDNQLRDKYTARRGLEIRSNQLAISYSRLLYNVFIFIQIFTEGISLQRPILFLVSTLVNLVLVMLTDSHSNLCYLHAPVSVLSFATFVFNDASDYQQTADHLGLMIGFISICYLSATFLSRTWQLTAATQCAATLWVHVYFSTQLGYNGVKIAPGLVLLCLSCSLITHHCEKKDVQEFQEYEQV